MNVLTGEQLVIKSWCTDLDSKAEEQARNIANLPFAFKHIALMPDAHMGYGMPIGGVLATRKVIVPNAVGVDIGCGMIASCSTITVMGAEIVKKCIGGIREVIPVGFDHHKTPEKEELMPNKSFGVITEQQYDSALHQVGTLGGGNHFVEIQKGNGYIWLMIHSGSRNLGFKTANYYNKMAKKLNEKWHVSVPKEHDLAFLPIGTPEAAEYLKEMWYCVDFAKASRRLMMERAKSVINNIVGGAIEWSEDMDVAHNYAVYEHHFGKNVIVHRKGAIRARKGDMGIIPGSQGTNSYIIRGLGNRDSFMSCSHGAGRKMGRNEARRKLNINNEQAMLGNIVHSIHNKKDLDEAPGAYKDIHEVMYNQLDLVEVVTELTPLGVLKDKR